MGDSRKVRVGFATMMSTDAGSEAADGQRRKSVDYDSSGVAASRW